MLRDLKGFYLKLGQILGSKADVLPAVYTQALSQLFDNMPVATHTHIRRTITRQLGASPQQVSLQCYPSLLNLPATASSFRRICFHREQDSQ